MAEQQTEQEWIDWFEKAVESVPPWNRGGLTAKGACIGRRYEEAAERLLVVGKSPAGWKRSGEPCLEQTPVREYAQYIVEEIRNESGFCSWIKSEANPGGTDLSRSPFWKVVRQVSRWLLDEKREDWYEDIAWTSLYKIAPHCGASLDFKLRDWQRAACREILDREILELKPDYVLFLTGWSYIWDFGLPLTPMLKGKEIEASGKLENGTKLIVTRQLTPAKTEEALIRGIADWIDKMDLEGK